jgi:hypothetical protein
MHLVPSEGGVSTEEDGRQKKGPATHFVELGLSCIPYPEALATPPLRIGHHQRYLSQSRGVSSTLFRLLGKPF